MATDQGSSSDDGSDDLSARTLELARQAVRGVRLLRGYARDLAQAAADELLAKGIRRPRDREIARTVRRLAQCERKRRQREVQRAAETQTPAAARRAIPPLLPRLGRLAPFAPDVGRFLRVLRSAAHLVATDPGVLLDRQLRLFELAYVAGLPLDQLTRVLDASSERTTQRRLRPIAKRIEAELLARVRPVLSKPSWARIMHFLDSTAAKAGHLQEKISNDTSRALKSACAEFLSAVEAVIDREPGHPLS